MIADTDCPPEVELIAEPFSATSGISEERTTRQTRDEKFLDPNDVIVVADDIVDKRSVIIELAGARLEEFLALEISNDDLAEKCRQAQVVVAPLYSKNEAFITALRNVATETARDTNTASWARMQLQVLQDVKSFSPDDWLIGGMDQSLAQLYPDSPPGLLDGNVEFDMLLARLPELVEEEYISSEERKLIEQYYSGLSGYDLRLGATCRELYAFVGGDFDAYVLFMARMLVEAIRPNLSTKEA